MWDGRNFLRRWGRDGRLPNACYVMDVTQPRWPHGASWTYDENMDDCQEVRTVRLAELRGPHMGMHRLHVLPLIVERYFAKGQLRTTTSLTYVFVLRCEYQGFAVVPSALPARPRRINEIVRNVVKLHANDRTGHDPAPTRPRRSVGGTHACLHPS